MCLYIRVYVRLAGPERYQHADRGRCVLPHYAAFSPRAIFVRVHMGVEEYQSRVHVYM